MQIEEFVEAQSKLSVMLEEFDEDTIRPLFDAVLSGGGILCIHWDQYAPSFNDGEPCYFSVHDPYMVTSLDDIKEDLDERELEEAMDQLEGDPEAFWYECTEPYEGEDFGAADGVPTEAVDKLYKFFDCEDLCEQVFGNGYRVIASWDAKKKTTRFDKHDAGDY